VVEINSAIDGDPALVNRDPYGDGWLFQVKLDDVNQTAELMSPEQYQQLISAT
jgi:glycine cleavage system H protein